MHHRNRRSTRPARGSHRAVWLAPALLLLSGCAGMKVPDLPDLKIEPVRPPGREAVAGQRLQARAPTATRDRSGLQTLFRKQTVTGVDLVSELSAMRRVLGGDGLATAATHLMGVSEDGTGRADAAAQLKVLMLQGALQVFENYLKESPGGGPMDGIREHLGLLLGNPTELAQETVSLPAAETLTPPQMQKAVNLAAMVIAARLSRKLLEKAQADFDGMESEYAELLERREKAATALYGLLQGGDTRALTRSLGETRVAELRSSVARMTLAEFSTDLGAQNLALSYLRSANPEAFQDYTAKSGRAVRKTQGILKTATGIAAFAFLGAYVGREVGQLAERRQYQELLALSPLLGALALELGPMAVKAAQATGSGMSAFAKSLKRFRVEKDGKVDEVRSADAVFDAIRDSGEEARLREALFRNDSPGLLYRLYQCNGPEAGRLLDAGLSRKVREQFAQDYQVRWNKDEGSFSFASAFDAKANPTLARLGEDLLQRDHRSRTDLRSRPIAELQKKLAGDPQGQDKPGFLEWDHEDLMRLILVNREGDARHAALQLGKVTVRPIPSMESIYAYEALVDGCRQMLQDSVAPAPVRTRAESGEANGDKSAPKPKPTPRKRGDKTADPKPGTT